MYKKLPAAPLGKIPMIHKKNELKPKEKIEAKKSPSQRDEKGLFIKGNQIGKGFGRPPFTEEEIEKICSDLIEWSEKPSSAHVVGFTTQYRKPQNWLYDLEKRYPAVKTAFRIARDNLLLHYVQNGLIGKWNHSVVHRYLGFFDTRLSAFEDAKEDRKRTRKEEEIKQVVVTAVNYANSVKD